MMGLSLSLPSWPFAVGFGGELESWTTCSLQATFSVPCGNYFVHYLTMEHTATHVRALRHLINAAIIDGPITGCIHSLQLCDNNCEDQNNNDGCQFIIIRSQISDDIMLN